MDEHKHWLRLRNRLRPYIQVETVLALRGPQLLGKGLDDALGLGRETREIIRGFADSRWTIATPLSIWKPHRGNGSLLHIRALANIVSQMLKSLTKLRSYLKAHT